MGAFFGADNIEIRKPVPMSVRRAKTPEGEFLGRSVRLTTRIVLVSDREGENVFSLLREQAQLQKAPLWVLFLALIILRFDAACHVGKLSFMLLSLH